MIKPNPIPRIGIHIKPSFNYYYCNVKSCGRSSSAAKCDGGGFNFTEEEDDAVNNTKKRVWWSDNNNNNEFNCMDFEEEERGGFGVVEDSFDTSCLFKVLNAFGWMVPAIAISMLLGTGGTNTFVMALVLPLAQSVVSFVSDTLWGDSVRSTKTKRKRTKKKPFRRAQNGTGMKQQETNTDKVNESYEFQNATNNKPYAKREPGFGGWDELDQGLGSYKVPRREPTRMANETRLEKKGKLSRQARTRGTPLLVRLLIAVFPFLGSWTRLL